MVSSLRGPGPETKGLLIALALSVPPLFFVFITPLQIDNMIYQSIAFDYLKHGKILYIGTWDDNFPGIVLVHILGIKLFGLSDVGFRVLDICIQLGFLALFYKFLLRWLTPRTAALAAILYALYYASAGGNLYGQRDIYGMMAIIASLHVLFSTGRNTTSRFWRVALAGVFTGIAILIRPTSFLILGILAGFLLIEERDSIASNGRSFLRVTRDSLRDAIVFTLLALLPMGLLLLFYRTIPNGLHAFYLSTISFNLDAYAQIHGSSQGIYDVFKSKGPIVSLALVAFWKRKSIIASGSPIRMLRSNERILYGSLILSSILIVLVQRKYLPYHFAPFFMLLLPLAAVGIFAIATSFARPAARGLTIGLGCLLCSFGGYYPENAAIFVRAALAGQDPFEKMYAAYHSYPKFGASQEHDVIHYLNLPENRAGCVELFSYSPELRLHLDRQFAGPYIMPTAIAVRADDGLSDHPVYTKYQLKWQREYMDTLRAAKPRFLIFAQHTQFWNLVDPYESWLRFMPGFDSLLESDYQYDTSFGWYKIWRRRS